MSSICHCRKHGNYHFHWNVRKERNLYKERQFYQVSPWLLTWDDENYYLVAY